MTYILKRGIPKKSMLTLSSKVAVQTGVDTKKYCGVIKLSEDPLKIQKKIRSEWK
jgi:hypothetical protein